MVLVPLFVLMTYGGATLSWYLIEQPLNQLKKFFPHDPPPTSSSTSGRLQVGAVGVAQHG
jgi:peptidoglycan/LPS O-acetylase OafA/YrhL